MHLFTFMNNVDSLRDKDTFVLEIPSGLCTKQEILGWYAKILMPEYFGMNWDAFDECIRDLEWVEQPRVILYHSDMPLQASPSDQRIYLEVLDRAVAHWRADAGHDLLVVFHPECEPIVSGVLKNKD
jgi:hypothetical protein